ncbi:hypothetical protein [Streptomyces sp. TRM70350]|uniref:hypothetical protein n=1 Tax=Streptomyces sp. TRM70350 TaxID=2856165 RepID=UPI002737FE1D|nr:hypothetical protein [Streptomyces sp. TRM70350]
MSDEGDGRGMVSQASSVLLVETVRKSGLNQASSAALAPWRKPRALSISGEDGLYAPEHPAAQVLLLTTTPVAEPALEAGLGSIEGLIHLNHETM